MARVGTGVRLTLGIACGCVSVASLGLLWPTAGHAAAQPLAVDRQAYVSDAGPDVYGLQNQGPNGQDPIDIHVQTIPGKVTYHSLIRLPLDALPAGVQVSQLTVRLYVTTDSSRARNENVNAGAALITAFPLTSELAASFDPNNPPQYDQSVSAVGRLNDADGSWSFDLAALVPYWKQHGNTGAAIVPNAAASTSAWSIGFDRTLATADAVFASSVSPVFTTAPGGSSSQSSGSLLTGGSGLGAGASGASTAVLPAVAAVPTPASAAPTAAAPVPATGNGGAVAVAAPAAPGTPGIPVWLLVLAVSATASVALLAQPVSQALSSAGGLRLGLRNQLGIHPRMAAVAAVLLMWSGALSVYANTVGRSTTSSPALAGGSGGSGSNGGNGAASTAQPGGTPSASASAGSAAQAGAGGAGVGAAQGAGGGRNPVASSNPYANSPNPPAANLFGAAEDSLGITGNSVQLCAHAALTFGPAFNIGAGDLNVYWKMIDDAGGIWGRKIIDNNGSPGIEYQDDGYQPGKAVNAAQTCADHGMFMLLGGIGFDQIPAVRVWAEQHHELYIHHIATQASTAGLRFSYTMLPTLEQVGTSFGQYYLAHEPNLKLGIVYRNSSNWDPGRLAFVKTLQDAGKGANIVDQEPVSNNQGDYSSQIVKMKAQADVVLIWENALAAEQFIQQSSNQGWNPKWLLFPFNLTLKTLDQAGVDTTRMEAISPWPAYTCNASSLPEFSAYRAELQRFEAAYKQYDPGANLCGDGGDLLFASWEAWQQVADLLVQCGRDCTRNKMAGLMLNGYHATVGANCPVDFRGDGHHGGGPEDTFKVGQFNGTRGWYNTGLCLSRI
jgi:ABC-type branched-subunit amino acid transport system substrate-binding protein